MFSLVTDAILKQMGLRGNITTRLKHSTAYEDDIMLTTRTKQSLIDTFQKLKCTRINYNLEELQINLMYLKQVQSDKYLGTTMNCDNSREEEI